MKRIERNDHRRAGRPKIGISSCLLGEKVRYNGEHTRDAYLTETFGLFVEWVPVCPEFEVGMGVPREPVRLTGNPERPRMLGERSGQDWTGRMLKFARRRMKVLSSLDLSGYILKRNSPSCGMERVRVYGSGATVRQGRGLFASVLLKENPLLPVEEEGRLTNPRLRENFIERVFAYHRWRQLVHRERSRRALEDFHREHKFLIFAHSEPHLRRLGRLVAEKSDRFSARILKTYGKWFMEALAIPAPPRRHANVLHHLIGFFSNRLDRLERKELVEVVADYHRGLTPLIVPITLIRHYVNKYRIDYLQDQVYLQPHPKELMLRNHV